MIDYEANQAAVDEGHRWLQQHAGAGQTWEESARVFFDERDRRERGDQPQAPDYAYVLMDRRFGSYSREKLDSRGQRAEAALVESANRAEALNRSKALLSDPDAVAALERLVAREIEAEEQRLRGLKVAV